MPAVTTPITPLEAGGEMFQRAKTQSLLQARSSTARPLSEATEIFDTDFEDESESEEYSGKRSFESDDSRRRSQTTLSSYDEAPTPRSSQSAQSEPQFELQLKPVEGPRGPHLFRTSQTSEEFTLQMSPLLPKHPPSRPETGFSQQTLTPTARPRQVDFSIAATLADDDSEAFIRSWTPQQVIDWMYHSGIDASVIDCFEVHDINGTVLLDLQFDDLRELDIQSFGKRHQLWSAICNLRGLQGSVSPQPTPFQDTSRPCTRNTRRSPSRNRNEAQSPVDGDLTPITPSGKKSRRRKAGKTADVISPAESVSIVAIEQLLPKPHKCAKGENCAKWRKQQRELQQLKDENGIGRFPVSPTKGGRIYVAGDPGNPSTADNIVPNVRKQPEQQPQQQQDAFRPMSDAVPSVVASSDLLGPGQLPEFALHADMLGRVESRDPQDNVRQFLNFQHVQSPNDSPPTPPDDLAHPGSMGRSESVPLLFPAHHHQAYPSLHPPVRSHTPGPREGLRNLPKLEIPRSASAAPNLNTLASPETATATSACRSATASPACTVYRLGTPASEMDVPVTAIPQGPIARDASQSVPPNMQYRQQNTLSRSQTTRGPQDWRRPSMTLPAVKEGEIFSPVSDPKSPSSSSRPGMSDRSRSDNSTKSEPVRDPAHHSPTTRYFGYGADCTHAGWMKKRKTKMLRHDWTEAHFRLKGTQLAMHNSARLSSAASETINTDDYSVACSTGPSTNKLSAAMKAFHIKNTNADLPKKGKNGDETAAFAFQLVPSKDGDKKVVASTKTHHFAVKTKDERIDWMRELMLAKALQQKGKGYDVEIYGVQAA